MRKYGQNSRFWGGVPPLQPNWSGGFFRNVLRKCCKLEIKIWLFFLSDIFCRFWENRKKHDFWDHFWKLKFGKIRKNGLGTPFCAQKIRKIFLHILPLDLHENSNPFPRYGQKSIFWTQFQTPSTDIFDHNFFVLGRSGLGGDANESSLMRLSLLYTSFLSLVFRFWKKWKKY